MNPMQNETISKVSPEFEREVWQENGRVPRLRVAMVAYIFPPNYGGASIQALELARRLKKLGVQSFFLVANLSEAPDYERIDDIPVHRFRTVKSPRLAYFVFMLKVLWALWKKRREFDILHFHSIKPFSFVLTGLAKLLRRPTLVSLSLVGNDDPLGLRAKSFLWGLEASMYKHLDRINCVSTALKKSCLTDGIPAERISTIPYGVDEFKFVHYRDLERKKQVRRVLGLPEEAFIGLFVGRVSPRKGCDLLFDAWERLAAEGEPYYLVLVGPYGDHIFMTEEGRRFERRVQAYVAAAEEKRMRFTGQIGIDETARYFQAADCFVFPSKNEGFGIVLIEAMASGVPVIATRIPDVTEDIIDHEEDGIVLDTREPEALASAIRRLQSDRQLYARLSENAVEKVRKCFTLSSVAARYAVLYEQLLLRRRKNGSVGART